MSNRTVIRRPKRVLCIGDLKDRIILHERIMEEPVFGKVDVTEDFNKQATVFAAIKTVSGKSFFAGANVDIALTHEISIRYRDDITAENWIEFSDGTLLNIVNVENLEERNEWLRLRCTQRGSKELGSAQA